MEYSTEKLDSVVRTFRQEQPKETCTSEELSGKVYLKSRLIA